MNVKNVPIMTKLNFIRCHALKRLCFSSSSSCCSLCDSLVGVVVAEAIGDVGEIVLNDLLYSKFTGE